MGFVDTLIFHWNALYFTNDNIDIIFKILTLLYMVTLNFIKFLYIFFILFHIIVQYAWVCKQLRYNMILNEFYNAYKRLGGVDKVIHICDFLINCNLLQIQHLHIIIWKCVRSVFVRKLVTIPILSEKLSYYNVLIMVLLYSLEYYIRITSNIIHYGLTIWIIS